MMSDTQNRIFFLVRFLRVSGRSVEEVGILASLLLLGIIASAVIYSTSAGNLSLVTAHGIRFGIGMVLLSFIAQLSVKTLQRWSLVVFIGVVLLLIVTLFFGTVGKGAQRWLNFGIVRIQPSEFVKIALPLMLAWFFSRYSTTLKLWHYTVAVGITLGVALLVVKQPDLGSAILVFLSGLLVIFFAGIPLSYLFGGVVFGAAISPLLWNYLHDYQKIRILNFIKVDSDPLGAGYQTIQSNIAIGSGGAHGKGWMRGTQAQLDFLPEGTTDFIFAAFSEEFGFIGVIGLFALYVILLGSCIGIIWQTKTLFGRLFGSAFVLLFSLQLITNIAMVTGLIPVVGVPLPVLSYGGSSLVSLFAGFGVLIAVRRERYSFV